MSYYLLQNDETKGPYTIGQLRSMWNSGAITGDTFYCEEGYKEWLRLTFIADQLEGEFPSSIPVRSPPPIPITAAAQPQNSSGVRKVLGFVCLGVIGLFILVGIFGGIVGDSGSGGSGGSASKEPPTVVVSKLEVEFLGYYDREFHQMEITGILKNNHSLPLYNLLISFSVSDDNGNKMEDVPAAIQVLDAGGTWKFKARTTEVGTFWLEEVTCSAGKLKVVRAYKLQSHK